jgi:hypothetical protein
MNSKFCYFLAGIDCTLAVIEAGLGFIVHALFTAALGAYMWYLGDSRNEKE